MFKIKSFHGRILLALVGVGLIPAALLLVAGTLALQWNVSSFGTAGPWTPVAESGQALLDAVTKAEIQDSDLTEAAQAHQDALSESLRFSRIFEVVSDRILTLLPIIALVTLLFIGILSFWAARRLSSGFSRPIGDLVGWTELIAKGQALPPPGPKEARGVQEFALLRNALRSMEADLEEGKRQAVAAEKLRNWTAMTRRLAHELKNPLTPMRLAATTIGGLEGKRAQEAGDILLEEITRLDEMARTFSQFGKMPEGPPSLVDVGELLQLLVGQHEGVGPRFLFTPPQGLPLVSAHYEALLRSFRNLLLNAIDATVATGEIEIRVWTEGTDAGSSWHPAEVPKERIGNRTPEGEEGVRTPRTGGWLKVEIQDSGPGLPIDDTEQIWEPDFTTKSRGTGLGLAMVRQTIQACGGRVDGRNNPQGGAVFLVELPVPESE